MRTDDDATPRFISAIDMLFMTILPYGPLHLFGTFAADAAVQLLLRPSHTLGSNTSDPWRFPRIPFSSWIIGYTLLCLAIGFPFAYRAFAITSERARAIAFADADWASHDAVVFRFRDTYCVEAGGAYVEFHVDRDTGLITRHMMSELGFRDAYNSRIAELIKAHGLPEWSLKCHVPTRDDLVGLLDATDLVEVYLRLFPRQIW